MYTRARRHPRTTLICMSSVYNVQLRPFLASLNDRMQSVPDPEQDCVRRHVRHGESSSSCPFRDATEWCVVFLPIRTVVHPSGEYQPKQKYVRTPRHITIITTVVPITYVMGRCITVFISSQARRRCTPHGNVDPSRNLSESPSRRIIIIIMVVLKSGMVAIFSSHAGQW